MSAVTVQLWINKICISLQRIQSYMRWRLKESDGGNTEFQIMYLLLFRGQYLNRLIRTDPIQRIRSLRVLVINEIFLPRRSGVRTEQTDAASASDVLSQEVTALKRRSNAELKVVLVWKLLKNEPIRALHSEARTENTAAVCIPASLCTFN